nr:2TM domain-containing protein [Candidatus Sigynarchaeota archaeon]
MPKAENDEPKSPFSDDALRQIAREKVIWALGVKIHAFVFVLGNIFLAWLNLAVSPAILWFPYVLSSWLVGLGVHVASYMIYARGVIGGKKKGLILHFIADLLAVQAVIVINYFSSWNIMWFVWPVGGLAGAILVHLIIYGMFLKDKGPAGEKKSWMERKIDEELHKAKRKS